MPPALHKIYDSFEKRTKFDIARNLSSSPAMRERIMRLHKFTTERKIITRFNFELNACAANYNFIYYIRRREKRRNYYGAYLMRRMLAAVIK